MIANSTWQVISASMPPDAWIRRLSQGKYAYAYEVNSLTLHIYVRPSCNQTLAIRIEAQHGAHDGRKTGSSQ